MWRISPLADMPNVNTDHCIVKCFNNCNFGTF